MTRIVFYSLGFALALVLCAAPLPLSVPLSVPDAFAGQTVTIDTDVSGTVVGNSPKSDHTWDFNSLNADDPADLLDSNGNRVTVNSDVTGDVHGGHAESGSGSATATATGNSVTINGGEVTDSVYGGSAGSGNSSATATHNTVTISGSPVFDTSNLFGGSGGNAFTGNTLNVWNYTGTAVYSVQNFQHYNFVLPASLQGLKIDGGTAYLSYGNGTGSTVTGVSTLGGAAPVQPGTSVTLIDGTVDATNFTQTTAQGKHGATLLYDWTLTTSGAALTATLNSVQAHPQAKALSEGWLGGLALTAQGADLVAGQGMGNAVSAGYGAAHGAGGNGPGSGFGAFAALSGGWSRYNTGSHVDMNSVSLLTGLAYGVDTPGHLGRLTLGAFFEYGNGSYDTHNSFANESGAASVDGDGDAYYLGGGVLGRMDFPVDGFGRTGRAAAAQRSGHESEPETALSGEATPAIASGAQDTPPSVIYVEGSVRIGQMHNEYGSSDLRDGMGRNADYDSSSLYYGLHLGTGYIWNITDKASLDLYGKYFWTRQQGDSVTLATNDPVSFKDADSHRLRGGARFAYAINEYVSPYVGAAYEHEFDGITRASTYGYSIDAPSLRGDTGIGEIGLTLNPVPAQTVPLSFDLGVQGYTGVREGVTGSLQVKLEF